MSSRLNTLELIEVRDASAGNGASALLRLEKDTLDAALHKFGAPPDDRDSRRLGPGQSAVLFVWLSVTADSVPRALAHHIVLTMPAATGEGLDSITVDGLNVPIVAQQPRIVGPTDPDVSSSLNRCAVYRR